MKNKIMTMMMAALAFTACTEEDLMQPTYSEAGMLHITSVTIDGQDVARTRVVADGGTVKGGIPFNESFNGFTEDDKLQLVTSGLSGYYSDGSAYSENTFYAIYNADGTWAITVQSDYTTFIPVTLKPAEGKKWADASIEAAFGGDDVKGSIVEAYNQVAPGLGVVQGDIPVESSIIYSDWLVASTTDGTVTLDTDVKSPTLGATTIELKHAHGLLRLPVSAANVTPGTYIVDGTAYDVTSLGTLWAVLHISSTSDDGDAAATTAATYVPLTKVTIDGTDYLQAIVPSTSTDGAYSLTGFKAVMNTSEEGETLTLDLPFKVGESETHEADGIALTPNTRYPLTLTIAPHTSSVSLSSGLGKPGWGTEDDEDELSNELNEAVVIDGAATDVATVKADIEAGLAEGKRTIVVTGETLAAYSSESGTAQTVVGEAIRQLAEGTTVSLVLPDATGIAQYAFVECTALTSVSAPEVLGILASAFGGCTSLASVELPKATTIMNVAFGDCTSLASVSLPAATSIGNSAFTNCTSLTSLTLGTVRNVVAADSFYNASTTNCDLTLGSGSTGNPEEGENKTWAGMTWKSITLAGSE